MQLHSNIRPLWVASALLSAALTSGCGALKTENTNSDASVAPLLTQQVGGTAASQLKGSRNIISEPKDAAHTRTKTLVINTSQYQGYPAAFVSLERAEVVPSQLILEGKTITGDLFIEPGDPEIAGLCATFEGIATHAGNDTALSLSSANYKDILKQPDISLWKERLNKEETRVGAVLIVKTSNDKIFKLRIDSLGIHGKSMTISFEELEK